MPNPSGNPQNLKSFTSGWKNLPTRQIRVPEILADEVIEFAHKLDDGNGHCGPDDLGIEQAISDCLTDSTVTRGGKDSGAVKRAFNALLLRLSAVR